MSPALTTQPGPSAHTPEQDFTHVTHPRKPHTRLAAGRPARQQPGTTRIVAGETGKPKRKRTLEIALAAGLVLLIGAGAAVASTLSRGPETASAAAVDTSPATELRLGYFGNITHAPALVGVSKGFIAKELGQTKLSTQVFNAGPAAIEALNAGAIDATYIGPNPAINSYVKSNGQSISIIAGAAAGGAQLVVKPGINSAADLKGKTLASPQLGGTQDVALRAWLGKQGFKTSTDGSGDVAINPTENAQTLKLFQDGKLDGAWLPEPWASRLVLQAGAKVLVDEKDLWDKGEFITTVLIVNKKFAAEHPATVQALLKGHVESVDWLNAASAARESHRPQWRAQGSVRIGTAGRRHRPLPEEHCLHDRPARRDVQETAPGRRRRRHHQAGRHQRHLRPHGPQRRGRQEDLRRRARQGLAPWPPAIRHNSKDLTMPVVLENLGKRFGSGAPVLDDVNATIGQGEFVALLGASGCGKSTLLNIMAGLEAPTSGALEVPSDGAAFMFQDAALFPWLTARENIELALKLRGVGKADRRVRAGELLDLVHLGGAGDKRPHELSGGMRQRVALARSLAQDRQLLLMDEPFAALDAITRDLLHDELERIWKETGRTIVFVTHNVREAVRLGQRVLLLSSRPGRVVQEWHVSEEHRTDAGLAGQLTGVITARLREEIRRHAK